MAQFGLLLQVEGKYAEAESLCREAVDLNRQRLPAGHPDIAYSLSRLGWLLQVEDKFAEAESLCRKALDIRRQNLPAAHPNIAESLNELAVVLARSGRLAEAEPLFREMLEIDRQAPSRWPSTHRSEREQPGDRASGTGQAALLESERILTTAQGLPPASHDRCVEVLVRLYSAWNKSQPGKGYDAKAEQWKAKLPTTPPTKRSSP